jgi:hypothetical protein
VFSIKVGGVFIAGGPLGKTFLGGSLGKNSLPGDLVFKGPALALEVGQGAEGKDTDLVSA